MTTPEQQPESEPVDPREHFRQVNYTGRADLSVLGEGVNIGHVANVFFSPDSTEVDLAATVPFSEEAATEAVGDAKPDVEVDELLFRYPLSKVGGRKKPFDYETEVSTLPDGTPEEEVEARITVELLATKSEQRVGEAADLFSERVQEGDTSQPTRSTGRRGVIGDPLLGKRG